MANFCRNCGRTLPLLDTFTSKTLCDDCDQALEHKLPAQLASIEESIKTSHTCTPEQQEALQQYDPKTSFDFYYDLCHYFATSKGFEEQDLATLLCVQRATRLSNLQANRARNFAVAAHQKELSAEADERAEVAKVEKKRRAEVAKVEKKRKRDYCKECGKKLPANARRRSLCSDCLAEERKHTKGYCKECGILLPFVPRLNADKSDYLRDLCSDCEIRYPAKYNIKFSAKYIGGYAPYPQPKDVTLQTGPDRLEVPELGLTIPYNQLRNVQSMTEERLKASRLFLVGIFAFAWKKRTPYLVITFADEVGIEQNPVFDVAAISAVQPSLYQQMLNAGTSEPATPQPVRQLALKEDPMEKLAKLKDMVNAGLITEEDYNTKKADILAKM